MPDKNTHRGCGNSCLRCWRNQLKHANKHTKAYMKKHNIEHIDVDFSDDEPICSERMLIKAAYERQNPPWYLSVTSKPGDAELLNKRAYMNRRKRMQKREDSFKVAKPNYRTRKRMARENEYNEV